MLAAAPFKTQDGNGLQYRVPREVLQEIQARTSLVEVVGRYVSLQKRGRSYVGLCPFHGEKSPSFHVDEARRMFYCFGCQTGGDVFKFLTLIENEGFMDVVRDLAARSGVPLPERELTREEKRQLDDREQMFHLYEVATSFYERQLMSAGGSRARAYLEKRRLPSETMSGFRLGYAPDGWSALADYLKTQGHPLHLAEQAGLIVPRNQDGRAQDGRGQDGRGQDSRAQDGRAQDSRFQESGARGGFGRREGHYDRFRDRVIFPIRNINGKVIAFGGRILDQGEPKYLNSPEHPLFNKSHALYGLESARRAIGHEDSVLVVEGYFDALALFAAGIQNVVATCGTSLTKYHLHILKRYTRKVVVVYDGDKAGQNAAERSLPLFLDEGLWPYFIVLPEGKDPDEVVLAEGTDAFKQRIKQAVPLLEHLVAREARTSAGDARKREASLEKLAPLLARLSPEKLDYYVSLMARHFGMADQVVHDYIMNAQQSLARQNPRASGGLQPPDPVKVRQATSNLPALPAEEGFLVQWILQRPEEILPDCISAEIEHFFLHEGLKKVIALAIDRFQQGLAVEAVELIPSIDSPALQTRLSELAVKPLPVNDGERDRAKEQCLLGIKLGFFQQVASRLKGEIAHQDSLGNSAQVLELMGKKQAIDKELHSLKARISGKLT